MTYIEAHITRVVREDGSEWGEIHTDDATVKKLTTKIPEKITEAAALKQSGALAGIEYTEKVRSVDGRTYRNFYYERAGSLHTEGSSPASDGVEIVPQAQGREDPPSRRWSIALQGGGKLAVATLPLMPTEQRDFETQKTIARAWAEFFFFTPPPAAPSYPGERDQHRPPDGPPPYDDSDVPPF